MGTLQDEFVTPSLGGHYLLADPLRAAGSEVLRNTGRVRDRRVVQYDSFHDLLADARRLADVDVRTLGNWSLGQILDHLARTMHLSIDGADFPVPWWIRVAGRLPYLRRRLLRGPAPAGFRMPAGAARRLVPGPTTTEAGLAALELAVERLQEDTERAGHPILGELSLADWDAAHLRHGELHLSFVWPR